MKEIVKRHSRKIVSKIIFFDEKLFLAKHCYNAKDDVYSITVQYIPENV